MSIEGQIEINTDNLIYQLEVKTEKLNFLSKASAAVGIFMTGILLAKVTSGFELTEDYLNLLVPFACFSVLISLNVWKKSVDDNIAFLENQPPTPPHNNFVV